VLTAPTVEEILQIADAYGGHIDLIVTDVVMPKMGGRQVAEHIGRLRSGTKCCLCQDIQKMRSSIKEFWK
jgi:CheY-like chemotaxis protein